MMELFATLAIFLILGAFYKNFCMASVEDNTLGRKFCSYLGGFYGNVLHPGLVWFMFPGTKIMTHETPPREKQKQIFAFKAEPKKGFIIVVKGTLIFGINPDMNEGEEFEKFHRNEGSLESSALAHIRVWIDDRIRQEENPNENGTLAQVEKEAIAELKRYVKNEFAAIVITAEFKMDVDEDVRKAIEEEKKQERLNAAEQKRQEQFNKMVVELMGEDKTLSKKDAATIILARMDKKASISDQTWNIKGLEGLGEAAKIVVSALTEKEKK